MKLYIDTTDSEKIFIELDGERFSSRSKVKKAQALLPLIDKALKSKNKDIHEVTEISYNLGPGSATGIRVGAAVAQALEFALELDRS